MDTTTAENTDGIPTPSVEELDIKGKESRVMVKLVMIKRQLWAGRARPSGIPVCSWKGCDKTARPPSTYCATHGAKAKPGAGQASGHVTEEQEQETTSTT